MKKFCKVSAIVLSVVMLLSMTVMAEPTTAVQNEILAYGDTTASWKQETTSNGELLDIVTVTVSGEKIIDGEYLVLMVTGDGSKIDDTTIKYIDQKSVTNGAKTVTFEVIPSAMLNGVIMICGLPDPADENGKTSVVAVIIDGAIAVGDVNGDGEIDLKDLTRLARYLAFDKTATVVSETVIDTDGDGESTMKDLTRLARYIAKAPGVALGK